MPVQQLAVRAEVIPGWSWSSTLPVFVGHSLWHSCVRLDMGAQVNQAPRCPSCCPGASCMQLWAEAQCLLIPIFPGLCLQPSPRKLPSLLPCVAGVSSTCSSASPGFSQGCTHWPFVAWIRSSVTFWALSPSCFSFCPGLLPHPLGSWPAPLSPVSVPALVESTLHRNLSSTCSVPLPPCTCALLGSPVQQPLWPFSQHPVYVPRQAPVALPTRVGVALSGPGLKSRRWD